MYILDRHHVWRSHDPMFIQIFDFCEEKKRIHMPFFILLFLVQINLNLSNLTQLDSIWLNFAQLGSTWVNLGQLGTIWVNLGQLGSIWDNLGQLGSTLNLD